jgi:hypothetical protein
VGMVWITRSLAEQRSRTPNCKTPSASVWYVLEIMKDQSPVKWYLSYFGFRYPATKHQE